MRKGRQRKAQTGHLMAGLMAIVAILMIFSTITFQAWVDVIRRDKEADMMFRAKDIVRSIQRYRKEHGGVGPEKLEQLMEPGTRGQYYMRRLWEDPLVKDGKWGLLYAGPGGTIIDPNGEGAEGDFDPSQGLSGGSGGLSGSRAGGGRPAAGANPRDRRRPPVQGTPGQPAGGTAGGTGIGDQAAGGAQVGGLRIAGVKSLATDTPYRVYNGLSVYAEWHFTYLDLEAKVPGQPGQPGQVGQPGGLPDSPANRRPRPGANRNRLPDPDKGDVIDRPPPRRRPRDGGGGR